MSDYICPECGKECDIEPEDQGVGWTEAWGRRDFDTCMVMVSSCCGVEVEGESYMEWHQNQLCLKADAEYDEWKERDRGL